jgi:hypothetical protein
MVTENISTKETRKIVKTTDHRPPRGLLSLNAQKISLSLTGGTLWPYLVSNHADSFRNPKDTDNCNNDGSWRLVARRGRITNRLEREAASSRPPPTPYGWGETRKECYGPPKRGRPVLDIRGLATTLRGTRGTHWKALCKVILKLGTENPLYHVLNNGTK